VNDYIPTNNDVRTRVSVVIPTRDRSALLGEALTSVRALEGPDLDFEIIVANDGSSDDSAATASAFGATVIDVSPPGSARGRKTPAARNVGLRAATGEFVVFLDDDDLWLPAHIRPHLALLRSRPDMAMAVGQVICTDETRTPTTEPWPDFADGEDGFTALFRHTIQIGAFVTRTSVRESVGYFDESLPAGYDADWTFRVAGAHALGCLKIPTILFRQRTARAILFDEVQLRRNDDNSKTFLRAAWRAGRRRPPLPLLARSYVRERGLYYWYFVETAQTRLRSGDRAGARRAVVSALKCSPLHWANDLRTNGPLRSTLLTLVGPERVEVAAGRE